jgi:secernin
VSIIYFQCASVELEQVKHVHAIVVAKPVACWGAEMGANECGVCIGFTRYSSLATGPGLTGQDLVRLVFYVVR